MADMKEARSRRGSQTPFEVYIYCGTVSPVKFTITEEYVRGRGDIEIRAALADSRKDVDERTRACGELRWRLSER